MSNLNNHIILKYNYFKCNYSSLSLSNRRIYKISFHFSNKDICCTKKLFPNNFIISELSGFHTVAAKFCYIIHRRPCTNWNFERTILAYARRKRESALKQPTFLLAVYWTRRATKAGNTIKHRTSKVRKLNPIASPISVVALRFFADSGSRIGELFHDLRRESEKSHLFYFFSPEIAQNFVRLWIPAHSRSRARIDVQEFTSRRT